MPSCTYGTQKKVGAPTYAWILWRAYRSWFLEQYERLGEVLGIYHPDELQDVDLLCASEVDVPSAPSPVTWILAIARQPAAILELSAYLRQLFLSFIWPTYCECTPPGSAVWTDTLQICTTQTGDFSTNKNVATYTVLAGDTQIRVWGYQNTGYASPCQGYVWMRPRDAGGYLGPGITFGNGGYVWDGVRVSGQPPTGVPTATAIALPAGTTHVEQWVTNFNNACSPGACALFQVLTTAVPYTPVTPVDPIEIPDYPSEDCDSIEDLCARLARLEVIARFTDRSVAWLQGSLSPDSWIPGTTSTGLTGTGVISAPGILGLFVTATVPGSWGITYETPARLIPAIGSVQWSIDGVPVDSLLIHYDEQHVFGAPAATDEVIYNFKPGVVGEITLLVRTR